MITVRGEGQRAVTFLLKLLFCMHVCVVQMKGCIKVLKEQPSNSVEGLLNALRYTTRHLNDDSTSKQIRALLQ
uniref:CYRIA/CYRIB Rac1 binding domain-containing protein n=1 Tax=Cyprinus carpio TaxID=7962 RepID=A0A8C2DJL7_CYPCA